MTSFRRLLVVAGLAVATVTATASTITHHPSGQAGSVWLSATRPPTPQHHPH